MRFWKSSGWRAAATLLLAVTVASCDHVGPQEVAVPQEDVSEPQELLGLNLGGLDLGGLLGAPRTVRAVDQYGRIDTYSLVQQPILNLDLRNLRVSSLIGLEGGTLSLLGHELKVPRGALDVPALFTMIVLPTGYVQVDVTALSGLLGGLLNVGEQGFNRPVRLELSYDRARNIRRERDLVILRLNPRGLGAVHEALPSQVNRRDETVTVWLEHFSGYCMAM